jgi:hypothetical protein
MASDSTQSHTHKEDEALQVVDTAGVSVEAIMHKIANLNTLAHMIGEDVAKGKVSPHKESYTADFKELHEILRAALARPQEVADKERAALATAVRDQLHLVFLSGGDEHDAEAFRIQVRSLLAASRAPVAVGVEPNLQLFAKLGSLIQSQDNRATDAPIFIVQQKRSYVTEAGYNESRYEWRETESGDYSGPADDAEEERLDRFYSNEGHEPKGWKRFAVMDVWEFVTACFTEQGCKDFIAINGHNLKEPRIYAEGSYRNEEFRAIRKALIDLATPSAGAGGSVGAEPAKLSMSMFASRADFDAAKRSDLIAQLRKTAAEIATAGHAGWGNVCSDAADALATPAPSVPLGGGEV